MKKLITILIILIPLLSNSQTLPTDIDIYGFINDTSIYVSSIDTANPKLEDDLYELKIFLKNQKSICLESRSETRFILNDTSEILSDTEYFNKNDFDYFRKQISLFKDFEWEKEKIDRATIISSEEIKEIFKGKDGWNAFRKKYPCCISNYSMPIFNRDKTFCIIQMGRQCDWLSGLGFTLLYKKVSNKWVIIKIYSDWIS